MTHEQPMNEERARQILTRYINKDNSMSSPIGCLTWDGYPEININGNFDLEEIEAIAWWMRNMKVK